jgi:energy-coupling factor transporter ATP-binding protein EcfA2
MSSSQQRPIVTELRLSAFKSHRGATFPLEPITLLAGASGTGKSSVLEGLAVLGRLASGADLQEVFAVSRDGRSFVRGGAAACVPQGARPDAQGRRGFRIGCTTTGPLGPVRLDLAVQVEPTLRIVGERLTGSGETLMTTALRDPTRSTVQAAWHTAGAVAVTRAPLPDDRLATSLLPLRVSGRTEGQRLVLAAAEQLVVALRGVFPIAPRPELMRGPVRVGDGHLRSSCDNLSAVLARTEDECGIRHGMLVSAVREVCSGPVRGLTALPALIAGGRQEPLVEAVIAAVDRGALGMVPVDRLGDGELRFLALALVLLTGPGVLDVDTSTEHLPAGQVLTVLADGLDVGVDRRQARELLRLAGIAAARGHIRLLCTVRDPAYAEAVGGGGGGGEGGAGEGGDGAGGAAGASGVALTVLGAGSKVRAGGGKGGGGGAANVGGGMDATGPTGPTGRTVTGAASGVGDAADAVGGAGGVDGTGKGDAAGDAGAAGSAVPADGGRDAVAGGEPPAAGDGEGTDMSGPVRHEQGRSERGTSERGGADPAEGRVGAGMEAGEPGAAVAGGSAGARPGEGLASEEAAVRGERVGAGPASEEPISGEPGVAGADSAEPGAAVRPPNETASVEFDLGGGAWVESSAEEGGQTRAGADDAGLSGATFAEPAPGTCRYGEPPFDEAGYDDFGYDDDSGCGEPGCDEAGCGELGCGGAGHDGSPHTGFDRSGFKQTDYVYADSVDDEPGHAEPAWLDAVFTEPTSPESTSVPAPPPAPAPPSASAPRARRVPAARGADGPAESPGTPCTCPRCEKRAGTVDGEDEVDQSA